MAGAGGYSPERSLIGPRKDHAGPRPPCLQRGMTSWRTTDKPAPENRVARNEPHSAATFRCCRRTTKRCCLKPVEKRTERRLRPRSAHLCRPDLALETWIPSHFEIRPVLLWAATVTSSGRERQWTCPVDLCQSLPMPLLRTSHHHGFIRCAVWIRRWESAPKPLSPGELGSASPLIPTRILISFPTRISDGHQRLQAKPVGRERQKWVESGKAAFERGATGADI